MSLGKARLREIFGDKEALEVFTAWSSAKALTLQDDVVTELNRGEPNHSMAERKAAQSKVYENLPSELQDFLKEKLT